MKWNYAQMIILHLKKKIKSVLTNYVYLVSIFTMADFFFSG